MGAVVREGARPGVPTPYNQALLLLVKACQEVRSEVVEALPRDGLRRAELRWARSSAKALGPASQRLTTRRCCCWSKPARRSARDGLERQLGGEQATIADVGVDVRRA